MLETKYLLTLAGLTQKLIVSFVFTLSLRAFVVYSHLLLTTKALRHQESTKQLRKYWSIHLHANPFLWRDRGLGGARPSPQNVRAELAR